MNKKEATLVALGGGARNVCEDERERLNVVLVDTDVKSEYGKALDGVRTEKVVICVVLGVGIAG